jgi:hypothetical protein
MKDSAQHNGPFQPCGDHSCLGVRRPAIDDEDGENKRDIMNAAERHLRGMPGVGQQIFKWTCVHG